MIDRQHDLAIKRQAQLLELSRSSVYYRPRLVRQDTLALMRGIDELYLELPWAGPRMLRDLLALEGTRARPAPDPPADADHGTGGALPEEKHQREARRKSGVPLSAQKPDDRPTQSDLGERHHVPAAGTRLCLPGRHSRLGDTQDHRLAAVEYADRRLLH